MNRIRALGTTGPPIMAKYDSGVDIGDQIDAIVIAQQLNEPTNYRDTANIAVA